MLRKHTLLASHVWRLAAPKLHALTPGIEVVTAPCRLPSKRDADPSAVPVLFAFTDVGQLNTFIELWRFPSSAASVQARAKARKATAWTEAISAITPSVGWFRSTLLRPVWWSPWQ